MENNRIGETWTKAELKLFESGYTKKRCINCHREYSVELNYKCPICNSKLGNYIKEEK